jgi:magnesium-transporting ATPase (P-type)
MTTTNEPIIALENAPHATSTEEIIVRLASNKDGLSHEEASRRFHQFGPNTLPSAKPIPAWRRLVKQVQNIMIYVLAGSMFVSLGLQHFVDAGVIFAVIIANTLVGFIQEGKAESALRAIMSMTQTKCLVIRDGELFSLDGTQLVPGDVVMLQAGDKVPADLRIISSKDFYCDESSLTGESVPSEKSTTAVLLDTPLAERNCMAYMGTLVSSGSAHGLVCQTGANTEIGKVSTMVKTIATEPTLLQVQIQTFAKGLTVIIILAAVTTIAIGVGLYNYDIATLFQAAIAIAVAAIPEGLPAIVTIVLAVGVQRMARKNALMRRLPSVEVLGSVDIICTDKTGTLTANAMTARRLVGADHNFHIHGEGYEPEGEIHGNDEDSSPSHAALLNQTALVALLCNDSSIQPPSLTSSDWTVSGDPTEAALLVFAFKHGFAKEQVLRDWPRVDEIPFSSDARYMATLHHNHDGQHLLAVKGAPDRMIEFCDQQFGVQGAEPLNTEYWQTQMDDLASQGMRVLALAYRDDIDGMSLSHQDVEQHLTLLALIGLNDPPRAEVRESIQQCHSAGIQIKMITGDNPITALAIAKELGMNADEVMTGAELDQQSPEQLADSAERCHVFARTSPANKLQLVNALRSRNHTVAMTGDGVNDAPALRQADIGVAMGKKGTDAARDAADFVLTDDNFSTITHAVAEGRSVYDNIVKAIIFILPTSLAESLVILAAILLGQLLPITPAQVIWINTITAITLALALAFERAEDDIMQRPPRSRSQPLITAALLWRTAFVGIGAAAIIFALFRYYLAQGASIEMARTVAVNALVMIEALYLLNCRFLRRSLFSFALFKGAMPSLLGILAVAIMQLGFTYWPVSQSIFELADIALHDWLMIILAVSPLILLVELEKIVLQHWRSHRVSNQTI